QILLPEFGYRLENPKAVAEAVKRLSDFYLSSPDEATPFHENWAIAAYLAYYFPLNLVRAQAVYNRLAALNFAASIENILDFGSGFGSGSLPYLLELADRKKEFRFIEHSHQAQTLHQRILKHV